MALAYGAMISFMCGWILNFWLRQTMPVEPSNQFVIPKILNGRTVYVSQFYDAAHSVLFWGAFALFAGAVIIDVRKDPFQRNRRIK